MSVSVSSDPRGRRKPIRIWSAAQEGEVVLAGLVVGAVAEDLDHDVGRPEDLGALGKDPRALRRVLPVQVAGLRSRARFDDDFESGLDQAGDHGGNEGDAPLAGESSLEEHRRS